MKYTIQIGMTEHIWDGRTFEEGENETYDNYIAWMNGKDGQRLFTKIDEYVKLWDKNAYADGGSLYNVNGIDWFAEVEISPEIIVSDILECINRELKEFTLNIRKDNTFKSCPIDLDIYYYVDEI